MRNAVIPEHADIIKLSCKSCISGIDRLIPLFRTSSDSRCCMTALQPGPSNGISLCNNSRNNIASLRIDAEFSIVHIYIDHRGTTIYTETTDQYKNPKSPHGD